MQSSELKERFLDLLLLVLSFVAPICVTVVTGVFAHVSIEKMYALLDRMSPNSGPMTLGVLSFALCILLPGIIGIVAAYALLKFKEKRNHAVFAWAVIVLAAISVEFAILGNVKTPAQIAAKQPRLATVVRANRFIPQGQRIKADDLRKEQVLDSAVGQGDLNSPVPAVGRKAKLNILKNCRVNDFDIEWQPRGYCFNFPGVAMDVSRARMRWNTLADMMAEQSNFDRGTVTLIKAREDFRALHKR